MTQRSASTGDQHDNVTTNNYNQTETIRWRENVKSAFHIFGLIIMLVLSVTLSSALEWKSEVDADRKATAISMAETALILQELRKDTDATSQSLENVATIINEWSTSDFNLKARLGRLGVNTNRSTR